MTNSILHTNGRYSNQEPDGYRPEPRRSISNFDRRPSFSNPTGASPSQSQLELLQEIEAQSGRQAMRSRSFIVVNREEESSPLNERRESLPASRFAPNALPQELGAERKLKKIAITKAKEGQWEESANLLVNVLKIQKDTLRSNHPDMANTKYHLANAFNHLGRADQAMRLTREALDVMGQQKSKKCLLDRASALFLIACIEEGKGNIDSAIYYVEETQKVEMDVLGYKSKKTINKLAELKKAESFTTRLVRKVVGMP